jgi:uncharacterized protein YkwD
MFRTHGFWGLLLGMGILAVVALPESVPAAPRAPRDTADEIIRLTNVERQKAGVGPVQKNATITKVAEDYAALMAKLNKLDHNLDGINAGQRLTNAGYKWDSWGENIADGYADAASVVKGWMDSPGHKMNILNPNFTEIGVGVAYSADGVPYYDQVFAHPASNAPAKKK